MVRPLRARVAGIVLLALCGAPSGCGSRRAATVNTGLDSMMSGGARPAPHAPAPPRKVEPAPTDPVLAELLQQQAIDTQKILESLEHRPAPARSTGESPAPVAPAADTAVAANPPAVEGSATAPHEAPNAGLASLLGEERIAAAPEPAAPEPVAPMAAADPGAPDLGEALTPEQRVAHATEDLVSLLRDRLGHPDADAMRTWAALAGLEAARPGAAPEIPADALTPEQTGAIAALREIAAAVAGAGSEAGPPGALADRLREIAERHASAQPVRIHEARLCTRVLGFGAYTPFAERGTDRFVAGRPHRAIVYVELDRFGHREVAGEDSLGGAREPGDRWAVELTQEINLYSDAGNLLVLRHPPERVLETSRSRRRDFYLVREVTLPAGLGAGRYNLKVTVRDAVTDAVAEAVIPIELVADARGLPR